MQVQHATTGINGTKITDLQNDQEAPPQLTKYLHPSNEELQKAKFPNKDRVVVLNLDEFDDTMSTGDASEISSEGGDPIVRTDSPMQFEESATHLNGITEESEYVDADDSSPSSHSPSPILQAAENVSMIALTQLPNCESPAVAPGYIYLQGNDVVERGSMATPGYTNFNLNYVVESGFPASQENLNDAASAPSQTFAPKTESTVTALAPTAAPQAESTTVTALDPTAAPQAESTTMTALAPAAAITPQKEEVDSTSLKLQLIQDWQANCKQLLGNEPLITKVKAGFTTLSSKTIAEKILSKDGDLIKDILMKAGAAAVPAYVVVKELKNIIAQNLSDLKYSRDQDKIHKKAADIVAHLIEQTQFPDDEEFDDNFGLLFEDLDEYFTIMRACALRQGKTPSSGIEVLGDEFIEARLKDFRAGEIARNALLKNIREKLSQYGYSESDQGNLNAAIIFHHHLNKKLQNITEPRLRRFYEFSCFCLLPQCGLSFSELRQRMSKRCVEFTEKEFDAYVKDLIENKKLAKITFASMLDEQIAGFLHRYPISPEMTSDVASFADAKQTLQKNITNFQKFEESDYPDRLSKTSVDDINTQLESIKKKIKENPNDSSLLIEFAEIKLKYLQFTSDRLEFMFTPSLEKLYTNSNYRREFKFKDKLTLSSMYSENFLFRKFAVLHKIYNNFLEIIQLKLHELFNLPQNSDSDPKFRAILRYQRITKLLELPSKYAHVDKVTRTELIDVTMPVRQELTDLKLEVECLLSPYLEIIRKQRKDFKEKLQKCLENSDLDLTSIRNRILENINDFKKIKLEDDQKIILKILENDIEKIKRFGTDREGLAAYIQELEKSIGQMALYELLPKEDLSQERELLEKENLVLELIQRRIDDEFTKKIEKVEENKKITFAQQKEFQRQALEQQADNERELEIAYNQFLLAAFAIDPKVHNQMKQAALKPESIEFHV